MDAPQKSPSRNGILERLHSTALGRLLEEIGAVFQMVLDSAKILFQSPPSFSAFTYEIYQLGVRSFIIVAVAALAVGLVMAIQFGFGLERFGAKLYVPKIVTISIVRELGPIFTALMMAGRVAAGITSEVGSMKVTQQLDAIRALGTDPTKKLYLPKIMACIIAAPMLTIIANFIGIFGGLLISTTNLNVGAYDYFFKSFEIVTGRDVVGGIFKSVVFGFLIGVTGCYCGVNTSGGTQGVGQATTRSVVMASVLVVFSDFLLTKLLWIFENLWKSGGF
jgi:phospholipid/cholesterol/gamma-HCH transport system permease protein